ncbi:MAG: hypothetical protein LIO37_03005 [Clostridiales bacterium]|nr:hypothetical protein [Clostridiales bacterium]
MAQQQAIHKFVLGTKEVDGRNAQFQYDRGWYSIVHVNGEEKEIIYKSRNAQEAYMKWNVYIGRKKERPYREYSHNDNDNWESRGRKGSDKRERGDRNRRRDERGAAPERENGDNGEERSSYGRRRDGSSFQPKRSDSEDRGSRENYRSRRSDSDNGRLDYKAKRSDGENARDNNNNRRNEAENPRYRRNSGANRDNYQESRSRQGDTARDNRTQGEASRSGRTQNDAARNSRPQGEASGGGRTQSVAANSQLQGDGVGKSTSRYNASSGNSAAEGRSAKSTAADTHTQLEARKASARKEWMRRRKKESEAAEDKGES